MVIFLERHVTFKPPIGLSIDTQIFFYFFKEWHVIHLFKPISFLHVGL
jgi:hypothetical protein